MKIRRPWRAVCLESHGGEYLVGKYLNRSNAIAQGLRYAQYHDTFVYVVYSPDRKQHPIYTDEIYPSGVIESKCDELQQLRERGVNVW